MPKIKERRKWNREIIAESELGIVHSFATKKKIKSKKESTPIYVGVHNRSPGGLMIDAPGVMKKGLKINLTLFDSIQHKWLTMTTLIAWSRKTNNDKECLAGLKFIESNEANQTSLSEFTSKNLIENVDFLLSTELLKNIPRHAVWSLLNCLIPKEIRAGKKLMTQGEEGDCLYIIQQGTCTVKIDKDGVSHQIASISKGDVVGEMAVLTDEPRFADVYAETDMRLWQLAKQEFKTVAKKHPDIRVLISEMLTRRLETSQHLADRTIGKYIIKMKLGHGAWSIVFRAVHETLQMTVAVKMLKHQMAMDEGFQVRFKKEAEIIAQLHHRNIIQVYDIEDRYQTIFIIMEYLEGEPLEDMLARKGRLSPQEAVSYLIQICSGLGYAHNKGIVHQDMKPANILVLPDGQIKVLDFGLACTVGCESVDLEGTLFYMAPEQIEGYPVDARTDIYAVGITAYEMVTGERPYPENDLATLMDLHLEQDIADPAQKVPDLPKVLSQFIMKSCSRDPEHRYQSMAEALIDLEILRQSIMQDKEGPDLDKHMMTTLFFFYKDEHRGAVKKLLEEFSSKAKEEGITVKAAEFKDVC